MCRDFGFGHRVATIAKFQTWFTGCIRLQTELVWHNYIVTHHAALDRTWLDQTRPKTPNQKQQIKQKTTNTKPNPKLQTKQKYPNTRTNQKTRKQNPKYPTKTKTSNTKPKLPNTKSSPKIPNQTPPKKQTKLKTPNTNLNLKPQTKHQTKPKTPNTKPNQKQTKVKTRD